MPFHFGKLRAKAAGRLRTHEERDVGTASNGEPQFNYASILEPLTRSRLSKLISRLKSKYRREREPSQNPFSVVTDLEGFLAPTPPATVRLTPEPRPTSLTPSAAKSIEKWIVHDTYQPATPVRTTIIPTSSSVNEPSNNESSSWATTRGSHSTTPIRPTPPASIPNQPTPLGTKTLRQVKFSGDLRDAVAFSPSSSSESFSSPPQRFSPFPEDIDIDGLPIRRVQTNSPPRLDWTDPLGLSMPTHKPFRYQPHGISRTNVNSSRERLPRSDTKDTVSLNNAYAPAAGSASSKSSSASQGAANARFSQPSPPPTPVLCPSSPIDHFYLPSLTATEPGHLLSFTFSLPPPLHPVPTRPSLPRFSRAPPRPPRPPRPPAHLCPPPAPVTGSSSCYVPPVPCLWICMPVALSASLEARTTLPYSLRPVSRSSPEGVSPTRRSSSRGGGQKRPGLPY